MGEFSINIPDDISVNSKEKLLEFVFEELPQFCNDAEWLSSRAIICPTDVAVDDISPEHILVLILYLRVNTYTLWNL